MKWLPIAMVLCACEKVVSAPVVPSSAARSSPTRWVEARSADDATVLEAPARVLPSPESVASLSAPLQARVVRVRVRPGQQVQTGEQLIDVLMPELLHAAGDLAGEQIKVDGYTKRKAQLEVLKNEGLVRVAELAEVEAQLATARAEAQAARATFRASGVSDRLAEGLIQGEGVVALKSPIAGVVSAVDAHMGEVRDPAGRPLVQIVGEGEGRIEARLPAGAGVGARFLFVSGSHVVSIELVSVSPRLETVDGSRLAWFTARDAGLPIGATGRVRVAAEGSWKVIPARALIDSAGHTRVRQKTKDGSTLVDVRVVARSGAEAVVEGLPGDAQVAAEGEAP